MFPVTINGEYLVPNADSFFASRADASCESLYRLADGRWFIHAVDPIAGNRSDTRFIPELEAVGWLIETRRMAEEAAANRLIPGQKSQGTFHYVPQGLYFLGFDQRQCGKWMNGQYSLWELPSLSQTGALLEERHIRFLQPGIVLEHALWPLPANVDATAGFDGTRHDEMLERLQGILEARLFERPHLTIFQSLQDRGCDLLIEWPSRVKYGVQLKSNRDVTDDDFSMKTIAQIQDSRQHGLLRLFVLVTADITGASNSQKVRGLASRISAMNDPYVVFVPPERAWTLLCLNR